MEHTMPVSTVERVGYLAGEANGLIDRELMLPFQPRPERFPLDQGHGVPEQSLATARVEHRENVGMLEATGQPDLPLESLYTQACGQLRAQHLESHRAIMPEVVGDIHGRHAAVPELAFEPVGRSETGPEALQRIRHGGHSRERRL